MLVLCEVTVNFEWVKAILLKILVHIFCSCFVTGEIFVENSMGDGQIPSAAQFPITQSYTFYCLKTPVLLLPRIRTVCRSVKCGTIA